MQNSVIDLIIRIKNGYMARKESVEIANSHLNEEVLKKLIVKKLDFDFALKMIQPSALREIMIEIPIPSSNLSKTGPGTT